MTKDGSNSQHNKFIDTLASDVDLSSELQVVVILQ